MSAEYSFIRNDFVNKLRFFLPGADTRIAVTVSHPAMPSVRVAYEVYQKHGTYTFALETNGGRYEGNEARSLAKMTEHASIQAKQFADDLNLYERKPEAYLNQIDEWLKCQSRRGLQMALPMMPLSLTGEMSGVLIHRLIASGLFGDLTSKENLLTRDAIFVEALRSILGRMPAVAVAGDEFLLKVMQALPSKPRANSTIH